MINETWDNGLHFCHCTSNANGKEAKIIHSLKRKKKKRKEDILRNITGHTANGKQQRDKSELLVKLLGQDGGNSQAQRETTAAGKHRAAMLGYTSPPF